MRRAVCVIATIFGAWAAVGAAAAVASSWTIEPSPAPPDSGANLSSVSCATAVSCVTVGWAFTASFDQLPLAEHRDSGGWRTTPVPLPEGASGAKLNGVSCARPNACTAVGVKFGSGGDAGSSKVLVARWNGTSWQIQPAPSPTGSANSELDAVSCPTAHSCKAVGTTQSRSGNSEALAESWDGRAWSIDPAPPRAFELAGVSCTSARACTAVGELQTDAALGTIAERWNGTTWTVQTTPHLDEFDNANGFTGVSCAAPLACTAVGFRGESGHGFLSSTLAEAWRGDAWSVQPTSSVGISQFNGVSCTRPNACTAVGSDEAFPNGGSTTQRWNGRAWRVQPTPTDNGGTLNSVSCPTLRSCTAVGSSSTRSTIIERYSGT